jgi:hypothetical protein
MTIIEDIKAVISDIEDLDDKMLIPVDFLTTTNRESESITFIPLLGRDFYNGCLFYHRALVISIRELKNLNEGFQLVTDKIMSDWRRDTRNEHLSIVDQYISGISYWNAIFKKASKFHLHMKLLNTLLTCERQNTNNVIYQSVFA